MLIINAVAVHFYARFLKKKKRKKKQSSLTSRNSERTSPPTFLFTCLRCDVVLYNCILMSLVQLDTCRDLIVHSIPAKKQS